MVVTLYDPNKNKEVVIMIIKFKKVSSS